LTVNLFLCAGSGLVTNWEQDTGMLLASGDLRFIRIWDSQKELKVQVGAIDSILSLYKNHD